MATAQLETLLRHLRKLAAGRCWTQCTDRRLLDEFSARRDEAAFAALVARHGPMVLRVCRRVLNHEQDAEDAFQATFLVLVQNARSIRKRTALAAWLHGVAYRTAMKAKRNAARRRNHEARLGALTRKPAPRATWDDVQAVLDEEIQRLPEAFRVAFVLCVLEGKSGPEAAAELGIQPGTLSSRLTRARQRLQQRLTRRGIELSALLAALAVTESASQAAAPAVLAGATLRSGLLVAAGGSAAGVIPAHVAALAAGVTRAMFLTKAKLTIAIVLTVSLLAGSAGVLTRQSHADKPLTSQGTTRQLGKTLTQFATERETTNPRVAATKDVARGAITFSGRVLDSGGEPVKNARVYLLDFRRRTVLERARTGADGRYRFLAQKSEFDATYSVGPWKQPLVVARAEGYGLGVPQVSLDKPPTKEDVAIQLPNDDVPIAGRVIDLQGRPVVGVQVHVRGIRVPRDGDLATFIDALRTKKEGLSPQEDLLIGVHDGYGGWNLDSLFSPVTTDAAGRFSIKGIGRERIADLLMAGVTMETTFVYAMTRPCETIQVPAYNKIPAYSNPPNPLYIHYGATFDHVAAPSKPVVGVVRDTDTGMPILGAVVEQSNALPVLDSHPIDERIRLRAVTDSQGRYRITGLPGGKRNVLRASPPAGKPYLMSAREVPTSRSGLEPVTVDFFLKPGVWIDVKVTDKLTAKPVPSRIHYFAFLEDNPFVQQAIGFTTGSREEGLEPIRITP